MSWDAASTLPAGPRLRLVTGLEHAPAAVSPDASAARSRTRRRPLFERLRPHLPCRSDASELRHTLDALGPAWRIVRGLPDPGVHALLVGPGGVFALTVQSLPHARVAVGGTTVTVDGQPIPLVAQRRAATQALSRRLSLHLGVDVRVRALVAVIHAEPRWTFLEQPRDGRVTVLPGREFSAFLHAQRVVIPDDDVQCIAEAALSASPRSRPVLFAI
jgi:hypothetical protein